ncbi:MAG: NAD(P)H-dependent oxidoreductase [Acidobacteria bacterium]|nr:NAD(P)H-dependent oxidoreductase [Acidobacteriota bacterium]
MLRLHVIVGSTRETRAAERVFQWIDRRARAHGAFEVTLLDLREWPLPMFAEHFGTLGDPAAPTYSDPVVKRWNQTIAEGDAFIFITPEYNHSFSGVLKNAIDNVWASFAFRNKPVGMVSYSSGAVGGARAVEQLALVAIETELVPLRNSVLVAAVGGAFDDDGEPVNPASDAAATVLLDDLEWWGNALAVARANGVLPPGVRRFRELVAEAQARVQAGTP